MKITRYPFFFLPLLLAWSLAGCGPSPSRASGPHVWIDTPIEGLVLPIAPVVVQSHASDPAGVAQFELYVNGALVRTDLSLDRTEGALVSTSQAWNPPSIGEYTLEVQAVNTAGAFGRSLPVTLVIGITPSVYFPTTVPVYGVPMCRLDQLVAPVQLTPADAAEVTSPVFFSWTYPDPSCHPDAFDIRISEPGADIPIPPSLGWGFTTYDESYTSHPWRLPAGNCFYWQAMASSHLIMGPPSPVRRFCIPASSPTVTTVTPIVTLSPTPVVTLTPTLTLLFTETPTATRTELPKITPAPTITLMPTNTPNQAFSISGIAWNDGNGNGQHEANEAGLPDVGVELRQGSCDGKIVASLMTDKNGAYILMVWQPEAFVSG